ncbi:exonuclease domain-containing protein [Janibacter sp. G368]|uniref:3'-5' exonuclease n=1 Tax=Janibacter sp. G368 TaxID=3420441 RepID=UPI003D07C9E6
MTLNDSGQSTFEQLTRRPILVLDTEYEPTTDGNHLISLAVVPLVRGKKVPAGDELYIEVNPGVPIAPETTVIHGFTDESVARKKPFAHHADTVLTFLRAYPDAIIASHTGVDIHLLRDEFERADDQNGTATLGDLPPLPVVDTSLLPSHLRHPIAGPRSTIKLATLVRHFGVTHTNPHHARSDARATAQVLVKLLVHAASAGTYQDIDDLLRAHDRGTLTDPRVSTARGAHKRRRTPVIPAEHLALHATPLNDKATAKQLTAWLDMAGQCVKLHCPHLEDAASVAAKNNGPEVFKGLSKLTQSCSQPGDVGTLFGGLRAVLDEPEPARPPLDSRQATRWDRNIHKAVQKAPRCDDEHACPSCQGNLGCPLDTLYQSFSRIATLGRGGELSKARVDDVLVGRTENSAGNRALTDWTVPRVAGYMMWMVLTWEEKHRPIRGADHLTWAVNRDLHLAEPRLALMECRARYANGRADDARDLAAKVLSRATTDPAFQELRDWVTSADAHAELIERRSRPKTITHPKLARPAGRANPNPYAITR